MVSRRWRCSLAGLILLACGATAFGGHYADPSGFSFDYPEDWFPVNRSMMGEFKQAIPPELKDWVARNNVDLDRISVFLIRNGQEEFLENLNVGVQDQQITVNDRTVKEMADKVPQQLRTMGVTVSNVQSRLQKIGSRDAAVIEFQLQMPAIPIPLWQKQAVVPGGGKSYFITCTATADSSKLYQPTFEQILASFQAPAPVAQGFDWSRIVLMGIVGGIAGGLIAGTKEIFKRFKS